MEAYTWNNVTEKTNITDGAVRQSYRGGMSAVLKQFEVSAWRSGKKPGATYGLRIGKYRNEVIPRSAQSVVIELEQGPTIEIEIKPSFWEKCPELRHPLIREWLQAYGLDDWPDGKPARFTATKVSEGRFRIALNFDALQLAEVRRRISQVDSGEVKLVSADEAFEQVRQLIEK